MSRDEKFNLTGANGVNGEKRFSQEVTEIKEWKIGTMESWKNGDAEGSPLGAG